MIKVNWDATIDKSRKKMGVIVIVIDHDGNDLATMCSFKPYIIDPTLLVETYAVCKAVEFCKDLGIQNIILESDALEISSACDVQGRTILESV